MAKFPVTQELVEHLVREQFPEWASLKVKPVKTSGWDNYTYHLGPKMLIRLPSEHCYANQVIKESTWLPYIKKHLKTKVPIPLGLGSASKEYPFQWAVYEWIDGKTLSTKSLQSSNTIAYEVAHFLNELSKVPVEKEFPVSGEENFFRGGLLEHYDAEARQGIALLPSEFDQNQLIEIWDRAVNTPININANWVHGDMSPDNILVNELGHLEAVIDFGLMCVGDPACDYVLAWTYFDSRAQQLFIETLKQDINTWNRAKGWALWKAVISLVQKNQSGEHEKTIRKLLNN
ncbi:MAG: hypothetical protein CMF48_04120 [Legionellales bacterium]|nr:hypothetical protein [Legionellales bacterium]